MNIKSILSYLGILLIWAVVFDGLLYFLYSHPLFLQSWHRAAQSYYLDYERNIIQFDPRCANYDSKLGYRLKQPGCIFENREYKITVDVNQLGVRDDNLSLDKPAVAVIGDSFAFGWGVENSKIFPSLIESQLGLKTINASIPSYGTARELMLLSEVDTSKLRYLVLQFCENDQDENISFISHGGHLEAMTEEKYQKAAQNNPSRNHYFPGKLFRYLPKLFWKKLTASTPPISSQPAHDKAKVLLETLKLSPVPLDKLEKIVIMEANPFYLLDPYFEEALKEEIAKDPDNQIFKKISAINLAANLSKDDYFIFDDHWNENGHRKVAELVSSQLP